MVAVKFDSCNNLLSLYCIILYLYIYIALLAVHTDQKRLQCERPREKRAVWRERKEALGSPVNKVDRVEGLLPSPILSWLCDRMRKGGLVAYS